MNKIAIIEDDLAIAQMYRLKFEAEGYVAEIADNGVDGLALCERMTPDIVLLDLMMPAMNGHEMLEKMRQTEWGKHLKVVILTNIGKQEAPEELNKLNVADYIVKAEMTPREVADKVKLELNKAGVAAPASSQPMNPAVNDPASGNAASDAQTPDPSGPPAPTQDTQPPS